MTVPSAPTESDFRALARSSRRLWRSLRVVVHPAIGPSYRAWVLRPDQIRVEALDGTVIQAGTRTEGLPARYVLASTSEATNDAPEVNRPVEARALEDEALALIADLAVREPGEDVADTVWRAYEEALRRRREATPRLTPSGWLADPPVQRLEDDVPFHENYQWVAMLEPDELADGTSREEDPTELPDWESMTETELAIREATNAIQLAREAHALGREDVSLWNTPPASYDRVSVVDHHGRPALEALLTTHPEYEPRCSCCPLLDGHHAAELEYGDGAGDGRGVTFRVRLDAGTGVCVEVERMDGGEPGLDFTAVIEEQDATYPPDLFTEARAGWRRLWPSGPSR